MRFYHCTTSFRILLTVLISLHAARSEYFSAINELEKLLQTERGIVNALDNYLKSEEERLLKLKRLSQRYSTLDKAAKKDTHLFLANPVNAFLLVKHLTTDWNTTKTLVGNSESQNLLSNITSQEGHYPDEEDLNGAALALMRLQHTYLLDPVSIADGRIKGTEPSTKLTADDCFELGKQAYYAGLFNDTVKWMQESLNRYDKEEIQTVSKITVMEYIAAAAYDSGNFTLGMELTDKIFKEDPDLSRLYKHMEYYKYRLKEWQEYHNSRRNDELAKAKSVFTYLVRGREYTDEMLFDRYEKLCREELSEIRKDRNKLFCYFSNRNNTYLILQPVKVEMMSLDPKIFLFHDVISEKERQLIKQLSAPKLQRGTIQDGRTGETRVSVDRISKNTHLDDDEHEMVAKLNKRMEIITGLTTTSAEPLHLINYGIGGHYEPHIDYAHERNSTEFFRLMGNRIATWIFYLSDVFAGGSTVFPIIGVNVKPVKGAAAFWYNLHENGEGDLGTLHAACPVLSGSKWVGTKWFHEVGNEFRRSCSLDPKE